MPETMRQHIIFPTSIDTFWPLGHLLGYARVSTGDQDAQLQFDALTKARCYRIFIDTASGALEPRPELDKLLDQIRPGDTLVVWRMDCLGRSIRHPTNHMNALQQQGIEFKSLHENIDTSSSRGRLVFNIFASLAVFERDLIRERTNAGLAAAHARGRTGGRPATPLPNKLRTAKRLNEQSDMTVAQIGEVLGVSRSTVYRALRAGRRKCVANSALRRDYRRWLPIQFTEHASCYASTAERLR